MSQVAPPLEPTSTSSETAPRSDAGGEDAETGLIELDALTSSFEALDVDEEGESTALVSDADARGEDPPVAESRASIDGDAEAALQDLEDDFFRTGTAVSHADIDRTAARYALDALKMAELVQRSLDRELLSEEDALDLTDERPPAPGSAIAPSRAGILDSLQLYFDDLGRFPLLSATDEVNLARAYEAGQAAREKLESENGLAPAVIAQLEQAVERGDQAFARFLGSNLRLVVNIAKRYRGQGLDFSDLIQDGTLGLIRAVQKFDYRKGFKFSTYATWWIRQSTQRAIDDKGRVIRIPVHVKERLRKLAGREAKLTMLLGREPTAAELADSLRWDAAEVEFLQQVAPDTLSLDQPLGAEADAVTRGDLIPDDSTTQHEVLEGVLRVERLQRLLDDLSYRERRILEMRYGLSGSPPLTLDETGRAFNVTRERIRQIQDQAEKKLQTLATAKGWRNLDSFG